MGPIFCPKPGLNNFGLSSKPDPKLTQPSGPWANLSLLPILPNNDMVKARGDVHDEVTHQRALPLKVILLAADGRGTEHTKASQQLPKDPHRSLRHW